MAVTAHTNDATFLGLAPELQKLIISEVFHNFPSSFESIALACKQTYDVSKAFIAQHNMNIRDFRHFQYRSRGPMCSDLQILIDYFGKTPTLGHYVNSADFDGPIHKGSSKYPRIAIRDERVHEFWKSDALSLPPTLRKAFAEGFDSLKPDTSRMQDQNQVSHFLAVWEDLICLSSNPICVLPTLALMAMMYNVTDVTLPPEWSFLEGTDPEYGEPEYDLSAVQNEFIRLVNDRSPTRQAIGLRKLKRVYFPGGFLSEPSHLRALTMLMALRTVEEVTAVRCTTLSFKWPHEPLSSLRILQLYQCNVITGGGKGFRDLLECLPKLEVLRYAHHTDSSIPRLSGGNPWDINDFFSLFGEHTQLTLKDLSVCGYGPYYQPEPSLCRLPRFEALVSLELELECFAGWDSPQKATSITEMLPSPFTLQNLTLRISASDQADNEHHVPLLEILFNGTAEQREQLRECTVTLLKNNRTHHGHFHVTWGINEAPIEESELKDIEGVMVRNQMDFDWINEFLDSHETRESERDAIEIEDSENFPD